MADEEVVEIIAKLNSRHNIEKLDGLKTVLRVRRVYAGRRLMDFVMRCLFFLLCIYIFGIHKMKWR